MDDTVHVLLYLCNGAPQSQGTAKAKDESECKTGQLRAWADIPASDSTGVAITLQLLEVPPTQAKCGRVVLSSHVMAALGRGLLQ